MLTPVRKTLLVLGAFSAAAVGGSAFAGAASNTTATPSGSSSSSTRPAPPNVLTGDTAEKVKAAALKKVPGATVLRVQAGGRHGSSDSAYHAHVRRSDGTEVVVLVNKDFEATAVKGERTAAREPGA